MKHDDDADLSDLDAPHTFAVRRVEGGRVIEAEVTVRLSTRPETAEERVAPDAVDAEHERRMAERGDAETG